MHRLDGTLDVGRAHDARDPDRRGRDDLDVDPGGGERLEHVGGDAGVRAHPGADQGDLRDVRVLREPGRADLLAARLEDRLGDREVGLRERERDVGQALGGDVLDDHVDVDAGVGERAEGARGDPGRSGTPRIVTFASDVSCVTPEMIAFSSIASSSSWIHVPCALAERRPHVQAHAVVAGELDGA